MELAILRPMRFAPEYVTYVLNENFEDAKELFLAPLMALQWWKGATAALGQAEQTLARRSAAL